MKLCGMDLQQFVDFAEEEANKDKESAKPLKFENGTTKKVRDFVNSGGLLKMDSSGFRAFIKQTKPINK